MSETRFITNPAGTHAALHPHLRNHSCARAGLLCALMLTLAGCQRDADTNHRVDSASDAVTDTSAAALAGNKMPGDLASGQLNTVQPSVGANFADAQFLPVDEAFKLDLVTGEQGVELVWTIAPNYYLYKHKFKVLARYAKADAAQDLTASARFSAGLQKTDDYYGRVEVYYHQAVAQLASADEKRGEPVALSVAYQGCAEAGLCYPVQTRTLPINAAR